MALEKVKVFTELSGFLGARIEFIVPNIYQNIQSIVGVFSPTLIYNPALRLSVNELRRNGVVVKLQARTETGRSYGIICNSQYLSTALPGLVGKSIPEQVGSEVVLKKIVKVSIPRRRNRV